MIQGIASWQTNFEGTFVLRQETPHIFCYAVIVQQYNYQPDILTSTKICFGDIWHGPSKPTGVKIDTAFCRSSKLVHKILVSCTTMPLILQYQAYTHIRQDFRYRRLLASMLQEQSIKQVLNGDAQAVLADIFPVMISQQASTPVAMTVLKLGRAWIWPDCCSVFLSFTWLFSWLFSPIFFPCVFLWTASYCAQSFSM